MNREVRIITGRIHSWLQADNATVFVSVNVSKCIFTYDLTILLTGLLLFRCNLITHVATL